MPDLVFGGLLLRHRCIFLYQMSRVPSKLMGLDTVDVAVI